MAAIGTGGDTGVPHDDVITAFVAAAVADDGDLEVTRSRMREVLGDAALVDACGVIANFTMMTRIADAVGVPLDPPLELATSTLRQEIGVNRFGGAQPDHPILNLFGRFLHPVVPYILRLQTAFLQRTKRKRASS